MRAALVPEVRAASRPNTPRGSCASAGSYPGCGRFGVRRVQLMHCWSAWDGVNPGFGGHPACPCVQCGTRCGARRWLV